ncbi:hypothetical protein NG798_16470 [Ancylothrix sp. C2]|uniref:DUF7925 domain-containing protein n=1 Tax=Ancylothrix sp. D3o TaxID=2953691 RepID=UPI0021BB8301|nr:hypothetical protein [Ancylothrix sp. D3o]MCT7951397.1 hypothetical protein [Ancylothrix sp. D3o]
MTKENQPPQKAQKAKNKKLSPRFKPANLPFWQNQQHQENSQQIEKKNNPSNGLIALILLPLTILIMSKLTLAQLTPAGTRIENEATGTFQDPTTGQTNSVTSNKVFITVAEVAGITVTPSGITEVDGNSDVEPGDLLYFDFTVTNVGNDPTRFRIPNAANITGPGTVTGNLQISTDGGQTWIEITAAEFFTASIPQQGSIRVRVPVTVNADASDGNSLSVKLGNTPNNSQNQPRTPEDTDIFTVDNPDAGINGEANGNPINGSREASASQSITIGAPPQALPALYKTLAASNVGNPADPTDDRLTYNLALEVRNQTPAGSSTNIIPADLTGTPITLNNSQVTRILISDVIPTGTVLTAIPTPPAGWQVVFTRDDPTTVNALQAQWFTNPNNQPISGLANVTRIGFIFEGTIAKGTIVTGFSFTVITSAITNSTTIANISQVFGATPGIANKAVYDESGDQSPANFNDDGTPPPVDSTGNPIIPNGIANTAITGIDTGNNNTGIGPGGESTIYTVTAATGALANGPQGNSAVVGPSQNNDDFANKSAPIPPGIDPALPVDPPSVDFINTVQNTSASPINITLLPTPPANINSIPAGTQVTINYGGRSVVYTYNPTSGFTSAEPPIVIPNVAPNQSIDYNVNIDLPSVPQLTGFPVPITTFVDSNGDGVPGAGEPSNTVINRVYTGFLKVTKETRILQGTGPAVPAGQDVFSNDTKNPSPGNLIEFRITYTNISETGPVGNLILTANNITVVEDGTTFDSASNPNGNSWALDNDNADQDNNATTGIDTSNVPGSAVDSTGGIIRFFNGRPANNSVGDITGISLDTDVTKYILQVRNPVQPTQSGTFIFQRRVN